MSVIVHHSNAIRRSNVKHHNLRWLNDSLEDAEWFFFLGLRYVINVRQTRCKFHRHLAKRRKLVFRSDPVAKHVHDNIHRLRRVWFSLHVLSQFDLHAVWFIICALDDSTNSIIKSSFRSSCIFALSTKNNDVSASNQPIVGPYLRKLLFLRDNCKVTWSRLDCSKYFGQLGLRWRA